MKKIYITLFLLVNLIIPVHARDNNSGIIHTLHPNIKGNFFLLYLEGKPVFDTGACSSEWVGATLDDDKFKTYILPVLLAAKATKEQVWIKVEGCIPHATAPNASYPKIIAVDSLPR